MKRIQHPIFLVIIILLEFVFIASIEVGHTRIHEKEYNGTLDVLRLCAPAVLFISYLFLLFGRNWSFKQVIAKFFILFLTYALLFAATVICWGLLTPISGVIGAWVLWSVLFVQKIQKQENHQNKVLSVPKKYGIAGFLAGILAFGIIALLAYSDFVEMTVGFVFGIIIATWQLVVGILVLRDYGKVLIEE